jgi:1-aminocyclopropane-1-carboxylate deaminase
MLRLPSPLERLDDDRAARAEVRVFLKRDDLIHPDFPGNKWRKLKYNLEAARQAGQKTLLTFGGAYSNHLRAMAAAGHHFGFATVGIVRGEEHLPLNPVLARARELGMTLTYVDRTRYREKSDPRFVERLHQEFGDFHLIPEGGANSHALKGCAELVGEIDIPFDVLCCASGTGATLAGVATALESGRTAIGFSALKNGEFLNDDIRRLQGEPTTNWSIETGFAFGGFAKSTPELDAFIDDFHARHAITLDRVYEAKMMAGLVTLVERGRFPHGTTLVALIA